MCTAQGQWKCNDGLTLEVENDLGEDWALVGWFSLGD